MRDSPEPLEAGAEYVYGELISDLRTSAKQNSVRPRSA